MEFRMSAGGSLANGHVGYWHPLDDRKADPHLIGDDIREGFEEGLRLAGWHPDDPLIAGWSTR
jgi:hypothetical protein